MGSVILVFDVWIIFEGLRMLFGDELRPASPSRTGSPSA
jgi:hypothetical protein